MTGQLCWRSIRSIPRTSIPYSFPRAFGGCCINANTTPQNLTAIAIAAGGGSFSALRVGFGAAKGLATALAVPLIPIPTLDITAYATPHIENNLITTVQAGRGRVIAGGYRWVEGWCADENLAPHITTWADLLENISQPTQISGEIDDNGRDALAKTDKPPRVMGSAWLPRRAGFLAELGLEIVSCWHLSN